MEPAASYVFVAGDFDNVDVIDQDGHDLVARIPVAKPGTNFARDVATTHDSTRAYASLQQTPGIAMIDALGLQPMDALPDDPKDSSTQGINNIKLPDGANPFWLTIDSEDNFLYATDGQANGGKGTVYVININPFSPDYNKLVDTITVSPAPAGLRGEALGDDGHFLYVAAAVENRRGFRHGLSARHRHPHGQTSRHHSSRLRAL